MIYIVLSICLLYVALILFYRKAWNTIIQVKEINHKDKVSVVVACRNEEKNIKNLIKDVMNQHFDKDKFQMIIVDDHSEDNTLEFLHIESKKWNNLHVFSMNNHKGKKNAIRKGVRFSTGDVILCTDADCRMQENWIKTMLSNFTKDHIKFVSGPVQYFCEDNLLNKFQSLELFSLVSSGAAAIQLRKSTICNGANLAFRRQEYNEIPLDIFDNFTTDDISLLHYFKNHYKDGICFSKDVDSVVETNSNSDILSQLNQKLRWISNTKHVRDLDSFYVALVVFLMNFVFVILLLLSLVSIFYSHEERYIVAASFLFVLFVKSLTDYLFLRNVLDFFQRKDLLIYIFPFEIINAIYTVLIVPLSLFYFPKWKGRRL